MSLEFYTSEELIAELTKRNSFVGVVIRSSKEHKEYPSNHIDWDVTWSKMTVEQTRSLMEDVSLHFQQLADK